MAWLDKIPLLPLALIAVMLGMAPYPAQDIPHLMEKIGMLFEGTLKKPIDIFDLFLHGTPLLLLILKGVRALTTNKT